MGVIYGDSKELTLGTDQPILDELESQGLNPDAGCRSASCGVCACEVLEGSQYLTEIDPVEEDTIHHLDSRPHPVRLICRAQIKDPNAKVVIKSYHQ